MLKTLEKCAGIKSIQRGTGQLPNSSSAVVTILINSVDPEKTIVLLNGAAVNSTGGDCYLKDLSSSLITVSNPTVVALGMKFSWQVIEFY